MNVKDEDQVKDLLRMALPHDFGATITFLDRRTRILTDASKIGGPLNEFESIVRFSKRASKIIRLLDEIDSDFQTFWDEADEEEGQEINYIEIDRIFDSIIAPRLDSVITTAEEFERLLRHILKRYTKRTRRPYLQRSFNKCIDASEDIQYFGKRSKYYVKGMVELLEFKEVQNPEYTNLNTFFIQQNRFLLDREPNSTLSRMNQLPTLKIDYSHCFSLFSNLIKNSLKYRRSKTCRMVVVYDDGTNMNMDVSKLLPDFVPWNDIASTSIRIHFIDWGIGIEEGKRKSVFKPFKRGLKPEQEAEVRLWSQRRELPSGLSSRENDYSGMGIGLAIVKRVVDLYRGKVYASSEEGIGTCITIELSNGFVL